MSSDDGMDRIKRWIEERGITEVEAIVPDM